MEQTSQPAPTIQPAEPKKKTPVWVWVLGGCFGIIILTMITVGGLTWWAAKKVKKELQNVQPKLEQWQKDAEKMQRQLPAAPSSSDVSPE